MYPNCGKYIKKDLGGGGSLHQNSPLTVWCHLDCAQTYPMGIPKLLVEMEMSAHMLSDTENVNSANLQMLDDERCKHKTEQVV